MNTEKKTELIEKTMNPILLPKGFKYKNSFEDIDGNTWLYSRKCKWGGMQIIDIYDKFTYIDLKFSINASGYRPMNIRQLLALNSDQINKKIYIGYRYNDDTEFFNHVMLFKQTIMDYGLTYLEEINREYELKQGIAPE